MFWRINLTKIGGHIIFLYFLNFIKFLLYVTIHQKPDGKLTHIFVTRTFFYKNTHINEKDFENSLIMLFNTEKGVNLEKLRKGSFCITYSLSGWPSWHRADIEGIIGEKANFECKISVFRLFCPQLWLESSLDIRDQKVQIKMSEESIPFQVKLQRADFKERKFMVCPSRLFAFDQWHLFITVMELYRLHQVELVIVYIQSVDKHVFRLIKAYEKSGLVQLRPALQMPIVDTLAYNPNSETSWQNQLTNFQDCLYEFRESAKFIAFPDWDDFMFTSNYDIPYYNVLKSVALANPMVNTFIVDRYLGVHDTLAEMSSKGHTIVDFWRKGIKFSKNETHYFYGKAIYRPNHGLYGVDLHWANRVESGYKEMRVPLNQAYMIHARDFSNNNLNGRIKNVVPLENNFAKFVRQQDLTQVLGKLPKKEEPLTYELNRCLGFNSLGMKALIDQSESKCWNYHKCKTKEVRAGCVNVQNKWEPKVLAGTFLLFMLTKSDYVEGNICVY